MKTKPEEKITRFQVVKFLNGEVPYAIHTSQIQEIIYFRPTTPLPQAPKFIEGVLDLRGTVVPVINLKKKLEMEISQVKPDHILIVRMRKKVVGIIVDKVEEVLEIEKESLQSPQKVHKGAGSLFVEGVFKVKDDLVFLLDLNGLLTTEEKASLGEFR